MPERFFNDLSKTAFTLPISSSPEFHQGIPDPDTGALYANPLEEKTWDELLVISPFVQDNIINHFIRNSKKPIKLLSRKDELDTLNSDTINKVGEKNCYQFSEFIRGAEFLEELGEESSIEPMPQNLHAKLFISKKGDNLHWFLGSANATQPAFERNIEFIVELKGKDRKQYPATILRMLTNTQDKITLFEPYRRSDRDSQDLSKDKTRENDLRKIVYDLTKLPIKGSAEPVEGGAAYNLIISIDATKLHMKKGYTVRLRPLPEEKKKAVQVMPGNLNVIKEFTGYTEHG